MSDSEETLKAYLKAFTGFLERSPKIRYGLHDKLRKLDKDMKELLEELK